MWTYGTQRVTVQRLHKCVSREHYPPVLGSIGDDGKKSSHAIIVGID